VVFNIVIVRKTLNKGFIIFPLLFNDSGISIGKYKFNALEEYQKENKNVKLELSQIGTFFRQAEGKSIGTFIYYKINIFKDFDTRKIDNFKKLLEIYRFLAFTTNSNKEYFEHLSPYLVNLQNIHRSNNDTYYSYKITNLDHLHEDVFF